MSLFVIYSYVGLSVSQTVHYYYCYCYYYSMSTPGSQVQGILPEHSVGFFWPQLVYYLSNKVTMAFVTAFAFVVFQLDAYWMHTDQSKSDTVPPKESWLQHNDNEQNRKQTFAANGFNKQLPQFT